jgi:hypothetical protein
MHERKLHRKAKTMLPFPPQHWANIQGASSAFSDASRSALVSSVGRKSQVPIPSAKREFDIRRGAAPMKSMGNPRLDPLISQIHLPVESALCGELARLTDFAQSSFPTFR